MVWKYPKNLGTLSLAFVYFLREIFISAFFLFWKYPKRFCAVLHENIQFQWIFADFVCFLALFLLFFYKSSYLSRSNLFAATRLVSHSSFPLPHWSSTSLKLQGWSAWYVDLVFFYFIQTFSQLWSGDMYSLDREHLPADRSWLQHIFHDLLPHQSELSWFIQRSLWEQWFLVYRRFGQVLVYVWARLFCRLLHHPAVLCLHIPG